MTAFGTLDGTIGFRQAASIYQPPDNRSLNPVPLGNFLLRLVWKKQGGRRRIPSVRIEFVKWNVSIGPLYT